MVAENDSTSADDRRPATVASGSRSSRVERFERDIAQSGVRDPVSVRERALLFLSAVLLVAGPGWVAASYFVSHSSQNSLVQRDAIIAALFGLSLTVAGAAMFLRYSGGRLARLWMARSVINERVTSDEQHG